MDKFDIYPDGSCIDNGKPTAVGGWSFVVCKQNTGDIVEAQFGKLRAGKQTHNRAELECTYQALLWIDTQPEDTEYMIYCDSEVVINGINGTAGRNANRDIWEGIESLCLKLIREGKVRAHSFNTVEAHQADSNNIKHIMNCYADKLAKQGANSLLLEPVRI